MGEGFCCGVWGDSRCCENGSGVILGGFLIWPVRGVVGCIGACDVRGWGAGMCARQRTHLFCFAKKGGPKKATLLPVTPSGQPVFGTFGRGLRETRSTSLRSNSAQPFFRPKAPKTGTGRREVGEASVGGLLGAGLNRRQWHEPKPMHEVYLLQAVRSQQIAHIHRNPRGIPPLSPRGRGVGGGGAPPRPYRAHPSNHSLTWLLPPAGEGWDGGCATFT
jgi:hypothetical protein